MFWPDYFFFGMIKYLENLLAAYAIIYVYNNRKKISGLSIIVIIYFTYFLLDTFLQGRGDIHTLISNAKIALFFVVTDVQFEKEKYDTVNIMWWFVFVFSLMNFLALYCFQMVYIVLKQCGTYGEQKHPLHTGFLDLRIAKRFGIYF